MSELPDDALVVHGGENMPDSFTRGTDVTTDADGLLHKVSVQCAPGKTAWELSQKILHGQIGISAVGKIREAGGDVDPAPTPGNPDHCLLHGIDAVTASSLFYADNTQSSSGKIMQEKAMDKPRIYADLNKWEEVEGQFRVILTTRGTQEDLQKHGYILKEGMMLDFWTDDGDDEGNPDPLYFQGIIHYDSKANRWTAAVDPDAMYHASEEAALQTAEPVFA